jgi:MFS family permease
MDSFTKQFNTGYENADGKPAIAPSQIAIIVAMLSAGTFVGALLAAPFGDYFGRRLSILMSVGVFAFGVIFQVCANRIPILLVGRCVDFRPTMLHRSRGAWVHGCIPR